MFALMKCSFTPYQHLGQFTLLLSVVSPLHPCRTSVYRSFPNTFQTRLANSPTD